jgi:hypothetical protein
VHAITEAARVIHVEPDSELGLLLDEANDTNVLLEMEGVRYRVNRVPEPPVAPGARRRRLEPERVLDIIGIGESAEETNVALFKDHYLADAADRRGQ